MAALAVAMDLPGNVTTRKTWNRNCIVQEWNKLIRLNGDFGCHDSSEKIHRLPFSSSFLPVWNGVFCAFFALCLFMQVSIQGRSPWALVAGDKGGAEVEDVPFQPFWLLTESQFLLPVEFNPSFEVFSSHSCSAALCSIPAVRGMPWTTCKERGSKGGRHPLGCFQEQSWVPLLCWLCFWWFPYVELPGGWRNFGSAAF